MVEEQDAFLCYVPIFFLQGSGALSGSLQAIIILYSPVTQLRCSKWLYVQGQWFPSMGPGPHKWSQDKSEGVTRLFQE